MMVKAPRSKGCRICVERRIRCDMTRPSCKRCQKANRTCSGFEDVKFIDETPAVQKLYKVAVATPDSGKDTPQSGESSDLPQSLNAYGDFAQVPSPFNDANWYQSQFERQALVAFMCPNAYQDALLASFISSVRQPVTLPTFRCHGTWLSEVADRSTRSQTLTLAIRAVAISHLARIADDQPLLHTSRKLYGKALLNLNEALQTDEEGFADDTLSATMFLSFYEVFNCTSTHSWVKHAGGAGNLIRLRGVDRHRKGFGRSVFLAYRFFIVMESIQLRKPCFLEKQPWRDLCWDIYHPGGSLQYGFIHETFFHELVGIPSFMCEAISLVSALNPPPSSLQKHLDLGHEVRRRFFDLGTHMRTEFIALGIAPEERPSKDPNCPYSTSYFFRDIHIASMHIGFWATAVSLNVCLMGLESKLANLYPISVKAPINQLDDTVEHTSASGKVIHVPANPRPLWDAASKLESHPYRAETVGFAQEVVKSAEWTSGQSFLGPMFLVLALRMGMRVLQTQAERQWVVDIMEKIGQRMTLASMVVKEFYAFEGGGIVAGEATVGGLEQGRRSIVDADMKITEQVPAVARFVS